jgi:hypothetical protein
MGGPWKDEGFDPGTWKPPVPHAEARAEEPNRITIVVVGYVVAVVLSLAVGLTALKLGW